MPYSTDQDLTLSFDILDKTALAPEGAPAKGRDPFLRATLTIRLTLHDPNRLGTPRRTVAPLELISNEATISIIAQMDKDRFEAGLAELTLAIIQVSRYAQMGLKELSWKELSGPLFTLFERFERLFIQAKMGEWWEANREHLLTTWHKHLNESLLSRLPCVGNDFYTNRETFFEEVYQCLEAMLDTLPREGGGTLTQDAHERLRRLWTGDDGGPILENLLLPFLEGTAAGRILLSATAQARLRKRAWQLCERVSKDLRPRDPALAKRILRQMQWSLFRSTKRRGTSIAEREARYRDLCAMYAVPYRRIKLKQH